MNNNIFLGLISFILTLILLPIVIKLSKILNIIDKPSSRKIHKKNIPRTGGLIIFISFNLTLLTLDFNTDIKKFIVIFTIFFLIGFSDDIKAISYKYRLLISLIGGLMFYYLFNVYIKNIGINLPIYIGIPFTLFAISGFINAFNMIDGLNGLSSGIASISLASLLYICYKVNYIKIVNMHFSLLGALFAFFLINYLSGNIFIGDGGTYFLGAFIAITSIYINFYSPDISPWFFILINIYPVYEILLTIFRRLLKRKKPFLPDKLHFHHVLLKKIKKQKSTTLLILTFNGIFSLIAITNYSNTSRLFIIFLNGLIGYYLIYRILLRNIIKF